jgi:mRNA interferase MazF
MSVSRGDVVLVRLDPTEGSEIRKTRPAIVLSNNAACRWDSVLQVVPVTGLQARELRPYEALIASADSGLAKPSRAVANQLRTVSRKRLHRILGTISPDELLAVGQAVLLQLGLFQG